MRDGLARKSRGIEPGMYLRVGIDDYARGFRSGYYSRRTSLQAQGPESVPASANAMAIGIVAGADSLRLPRSHFDLKPLILHVIGIWSAFCLGVCRGSLWVLRYRYKNDKE